MHTTNKESKVTLFRVLSMFPLSSQNHWPAAKLAFIELCKKHTVPKKDPPVSMDEIQTTNQTYV